MDNFWAIFSAKVKTSPFTHFLFIFPKKIIKFQSAFFGEKLANENDPDKQAETRLNL